MLTPSRCQETDVERKVILGANPNPLQPAFEEFERLSQVFLSRVQCHPFVQGIGLESINPGFFPDVGNLDGLLIYGRKYPGLNNS